MLNASWIVLGKVVWGVIDVWEWEPPKKYTKNPK